MTFFWGLMGGRPGQAVAASGPASGSGLLLETGDFFLLETGDFLLLE
jgi:hypothetical protein